MTSPSIETPLVQFQLRPLLTDLVTLYTSSKKLRIRIVEKTILKVAGDPSKVTDDDVESVLKQLLHETAVQELKIHQNDFQSGPTGYQSWSDEDGDFKIDVPEGARINTFPSKQPA
jgi:hypothetical protein